LYNYWHKLFCYCY